MTTLDALGFFLFEGRDVSWRRGYMLLKAVIKVEEAGLDRANVGARCISVLVGERFVNDAQERTALDCDTDHVGHMFSFTVSEGF